MNIYLGHGMSASRYCAALPGLLAEAFEELSLGICCQVKKKEKVLFFLPRIVRDPWVKHYFIIWWALFTQKNTYILVSSL